MTRFVCLKVGTDGNLQEGLVDDAKSTIRPWLGKMNQFGAPVPMPDHAVPISDRCSDWWIKHFAYNPDMYRMVKRKPLTHRGSRIYWIHDNGGRPFVVFVGKTFTWVYGVPKMGYVLDEDQDEEEEDRLWQYQDLIGKFKPKKVFVGKSVRNRMTEFSGGFGEQFDGNSILLHIENLMYVFVGSRIYSFEALHPIVEHRSPVGNNDVPYPYAIDGAGVHYFLLDCALMLHVQGNEDPNDEFMDQLQIPNSKFSWSHDPSKDYDSLRKHFPERVKDLTKRKYKSIIEKYGKLIGVQGMKNIKVIETYR